MSTFSELPLLPSLVTSLGEQGLTHPTDIQAHTLPALLDGRHLVGVSETGSGKTLAYVLPMLHRLKSLELGGAMVTKPGRPRGLVLVPGRELGEQVSRVFKGLTHGTRLRVRTVLGGSAKRVARKNVAGNFEVLVATPGRLVQLLDSDELSLSDVRILVFDEADQVLDPGFQPVARRIVKACPPKVQLVMFSATLPRSLESVIRVLYTSPPVRVRTKGSQQVVPTLRTETVQVKNGRRYDALLEVIERDPGAGTLLFVNTRKQVDGVGDWLTEHDIPFASYRGEMDRRERRENLARFRAGEVRILIATDLGGRGLDIDRVERVINVHLPEDINNYLHRAGRTARAGRAGLVVNLVTQRDQPLLAKLRKRARKRR